MASESEKYYLQLDQVIDDTGSEYQYEVVPVEQQAGDIELDEDFEKALRVLREIEEDQKRGIKHEVQVHEPLTKRPEVIDDLVRNFLVRMGMLRTLETFQTEWYEFSDGGLLNTKDLNVVPDVYSQNQQLAEQLQFITRERDRFKEIAMKARDAFVKIRKERDFHRLNHRRVVHEKNRLISDIQRLKKHYASFEPALKQLKSKYVQAMKEKMLARLERDRVAAQAAQPQNGMPAQPSRGSPSGLPNEAGQSKTRGPRGFVEEKTRMSNALDMKNQQGKSYPNDSNWPVDNGINPDLGRIKGPPGHLTRIGGYRLNNAFQAHTLPISSVAVNSERTSVLTASDDRSWKIWNYPSAQLSVVGKGHTDWLSCAKFNKQGKLVATSSGDHTVKIWDAASARCLETFIGHGLPAWSVDWHSSGNFLASSSMDGTVKIWDLGSLRCRQTLRGHTESVNSVCFVPYSNILLSCSADKTLIMWDARTGLPGLTLYGHMYAICHCAINATGETAISGDSFGVVKLWDPRAASTTGLPAATAASTSVSQTASKGGSRHTLDLGPHSANWVAIDSSSSLVAVASSSGAVRMFEIATQKLTSLVGHEDAVQSCAFDPDGEFFVTGGTDQTLRFWS